MAIKTYPKSSKDKLAKNFTAREFACKGKGCCKEILVDELLVHYLQEIRAHFGKTVTITSGYRCAKHNKSVNGATASRHTKGQAADIQVKGIKPAEVAKYAEHIGVQGIGLYEGKDGNFVHIDTRKNKSFWYGHGQAYRSTFQGKAEKTVTVKLCVLREGSQGPKVKALQHLLRGYGYSCSADGIFGSDTKAAVKAYQKDNGLAPDGVAGEKTLATLLGL